MHGRGKNGNAPLAFTEPPLPAATYFRPRLTRNRLPKRVELIIATIVAGSGMIAKSEEPAVETSPVAAKE